MKRALGGGLAFALTVVLLRPDLATVWLLLSILVLVPLGLELLPWEGLRWIQLPAAATFIVALQFDTPTPWLALPWFLFTAGAAAYAFLSDRQASIPLLFLTVGGAWAVAARAGWRPLGFSETIVLLTAVHFHHAGFSLPLIAARVAEHEPRARLFAIGVIAAVPLVAIGITLSPLIEWLSAWWLAGCGIALAIFQLRIAHRHKAPLLALSSLSAITALGLAAVYALAEYRQEVWISIPRMIETHGALNAVGFGLFGLLGWNLLKAEQSPHPLVR